jgi:hypothetical protein
VISSGPASDSIGRVALGAVTFLLRLAGSQQIARKKRELIATPTRVQPARSLKASRVSALMPRQHR